MIPELVEFLIHIDQNLPLLIQQYGPATYLILFLIILFETGLVVTPFLPGDSLLFVAGMVAAKGFLDLPSLILTFTAAAILGDTLNYWIGNYLGLRVFQKRFPTIIRKEYIDRTYGFFEQYGGKTIFIARFIPVVRTFAPFLAGIGTMSYRRFLLWNILGGIVWSVSVVLAGYFLGTVPFIQEQINLFIYLVILVTVATIAFIGYLVIRGMIGRKEEETSP
jgi:membrane-associated protein